MGIRGRLGRGGVFADRNQFKSLDLSEKIKLVPIADAEQQVLATEALGQAHGDRRGQLPLQEAG